MTGLLRIHPADVVIATQRIAGRHALADEGVTVAGLVPPGHKVATRALRAGDPVRRYNQIIGFATTAIAPGQHVHVAQPRLRQLRARPRGWRRARARPRASPSPPPSTASLRDDGRVATRNYVGVLTSVNCSATVARAIADHFRRDLRPDALAPYPNVDGVVALTHGGGCATAATASRCACCGVRWAVARHANFGALLVVGLGCETNQISGLMEQEGLTEDARLQTFNIQDTGGTAKTVARGIELVRWMLEVGQPRAPPAGPGEPPRGRPAMRRVGRLLRDQRQSGTRRGGRSPGAPRRHGDPSESPEVYGGEHLPTRRAVSQAVADKLVARLRWWSATASATTARWTNRSAGNKAGGLTTILRRAWARSPRAARPTSSTSSSTPNA